MRITSINQAKDFGKDGLEAIELQGLKRIVILAGANGSGKTRLLNRIIKIKAYEFYDSRYSEDEELKLNYGISLDIQIGFGYSAVHLYHSIAEFSLKNLSLKDPSDIRLSDLSEMAKQAKYLGTEDLANTALPYIQKVQSQWWNATHPKCTLPSDIKDESTNAYLSLSNDISMFLGESLTKSDIDDQPLMFGKPIAKTVLSEGQKALLQWCVALHAQGTKLNNMILVMDEPENHLHPDALTAMLDRIITANTDGQIWIATHSVPLIASLYAKHADDISLYFMEAGGIQYATKAPEKVLYSLMGGAENIAALREFIDLPELFATNRFAIQCLAPPEVIEQTSDSDPQAKLIEAGIAPTTAQPKKILDFGCGKGRILQSLYLKYGENLPEAIDYVGWDVDEKYKQHCDVLLQKAYGEKAGNRWYFNRQELAAHHTASFDVAILCNVLHEIDPTKWVELFDNTSELFNSLKDTGELLILEDYLMPRGEYAHPYGFIVLETEPLQQLFKSMTNQIKVKAERGGRIKAHFIPKHLLKNVTRESVKEALNFAKRHAKQQIERLRTNPSGDFKAGRAHGFWVQQFANTTLALEVFN
jgi:predicted ATPase